MRPLTFTLVIIAPALLPGALAGCSTSPGRGGQESAAPHVNQGPGGPMCGSRASVGGSGSVGATGSSGSEQMGAGMIGDQAALCELNRRIASATPEERQAMLEQYLPNMSPDMREQHLAMIRQRCQ